MRKMVFFFVLLGLYKGSMAQSIQVWADSLSQIHTALASARNDEQKKAQNALLNEALSKALQNPEAFNYPFEELIYMAVLNSKDGRVRIFNWNVPWMDGTYSYGMYALLRTGRHDEHKVIAFQDNQNLSHIMGQKVLQPDQWYGALYYDLIDISFRGKPHYILLGWDGHDGLSTRKVIDVMSVQSGKIRLGAPLLERNGKPLRREVFEYASSTVMMLKHYPERSAIVFDDLAPVKGGLDGNYRFYGPSLAFNAYEFTKKGTLEFRENVDFKRPDKEEKGRFKIPEGPNLKKSRSNVNPLTGEPVKH